MLRKIEEGLYLTVAFVFLAIWKIYGDKNIDKIVIILNNMMKWYEKIKEEKTN